MQSGLITKDNVENIACRIVANELEFRGFRVTDLNKDGLSANVDLLAASGGRCWQIQVKGASQNKSTAGWEDWWVGYGYADDEVVSGAKPMFNRVTGSFYKADTVALVAVRTPSEYRAVVLPLADAEAAAQINLNHAFRTLTLKGAARSPNAKASVYLDRISARTGAFSVSVATMCLDHHEFAPRAAGPPCINSCWLNARNAASAFLAKTALGIRCRNQEMRSSVSSTTSTGQSARM